MEEPAVDFYEGKQERDARFQNEEEDEREEGSQAECEETCQRPEEDEHKLPDRQRAQNFALNIDKLGNDELHRLEPKLSIERANGFHFIGGEHGFPLGGEQLNNVGYLLIPLHGHAANF